MIVQKIQKKNEIFFVHEKTSKNLIFLRSQPFTSFEDHNEL
jgi:hypothetical protein